jgi:putative phosphoribosyl transferase
MITFRNREEAGRLLSRKLIGLEPRLENPVVLGIPRGGIPVGYFIAKALHCPLEPIVLRKLPIPSDPEAGFGAVTLDRETVFNKTLLSRLDLSRKEIEKILSTIYQEVLRRNRIYRGNKPFPSLHHRSVILTDDGLASGFTMLAAVKFIKKRNVKKIIVAVPVAHRTAYNVIQEQVDKVVVLYISDLPRFAVASYYTEFPEMDDEEVISYLNKQ